MDERLAVSEEGTAGNSLAKVGKILVAHVIFEANSFAPGRTTLEGFKRASWVTGPGALKGGRGLDQLGGAQEVAVLAGFELVPVLYWHGSAGPVLEDSAFASIRELILGSVREHRDDIAGIYMSLHGAMVTESLSDPEGVLLADIRDVVGPSMPIAASFDLHGNFTELIAKSADIVVAYHTCPHVDRYTTGQRAMRLLIRSISGKTRPVMRYRKIRMTASSEHHDTRVGPMHAVMARRKELEREGDVLDISILATQPWIDVPELGWSVVVMADTDGDGAQRRADELAMMLWDHREEFRVHKTPIADVLDVLSRGSNDARPTVVSDGADTPSGGSTGDGVSMLRALIDAGMSLDTLLTVTDPVAVQECFAAGVDSTIDLELGGRLAPTFHRPVRVSGRVATLCDGRYQSNYPIAPMDVGRTAVLAVGRIKVVITEHPPMLIDMELFRRVGLDPAAFDLVVVKSAGAYREYYEPIASRVFDIDTTGPADSDLTRLPFRKIDRPLWPFDAELERPW